MGRLVDVGLAGGGEEESEAHLQLVQVHALTSRLEEAFQLRRSRVPAGPRRRVVRRTGGQTAAQGGDYGLLGGQETEQVPGRVAQRGHTQLAAQVRQAAQERRVVPLNTNPRYTVDT